MRTSDYFCQSNVIGWTQKRMWLYFPKVPSITLHRKFTELGYHNGCSTLTVNFVIIKQWPINHRCSRFTRPQDHCCVSTCVCTVCVCLRARVCVLCVRSGYMEKEIKKASIEITEGCIPDAPLPQDMIELEVSTCEWCHWLYTWCHSPYTWFIVHMISFTVHMILFTISMMSFIVHMLSFTVLMISFTARMSFTVHMMSFTVHMMSFTVHMMSFTVHMMSFTVHMMSFTVHMMSFTVHMMSFTVHMMSFAVHMMPFTVHTC